MATDRDTVARLAAEPAGVRDVVLARRPELGSTAAAAHVLINEAEQAARELRLLTGGQLSLAVVDNHGRTLRERQGLGWHEAHEAASRAVPDS